MSLETFNCEYEQRRGGDHINIVQSRDHTDAEYFGAPWENIRFFSVLSFWCEKRFSLIFYQCQILSAGLTNQVLCRMPVHITTRKNLIFTSSFWFRV